MGRRLALLLLVSAILSMLAGCSAPVKQSTPPAASSAVNLVHAGLNIPVVRPRAVCLDRSI